MEAGSCTPQEGMLEVNGHLSDMLCYTETHRWLPSLQKDFQLPLPPESVLQNEFNHILGRSAGAPGTLSTHCPLSGIYAGLMDAVLILQVRFFTSCS